MSGEEVKTQIAGEKGVGEKGGGSKTHVANFRGRKKLRKPGEMTETILISPDAHYLRIFKKDIAGILRIGDRINKMGWNEKRVREELGSVLRPNKVEGMLSFLDNYFNVFLVRYPAEGQAAYSQNDLREHLEYMCLETAKKMLEGKNPYFSFAITGSFGFVSGAGWDTNIILKKARESAQAKGFDLGYDTIEREHSLIFRYIAYICPPAGENQEKSFKRLLEEEEKVYQSIGLKPDYLIKEIIGMDDFEWGAFDRKKLLAVPGLRAVDSQFNYYGKKEKEKGPEDFPPVYLLFQPLKENGRLIPYSHIIAAVMANLVYRGHEEINLEPTPKVLKKFMDDALANVKIVEIKSVKYVELATLEECIALEKSVQVQDSGKK